MRLSTPWGLRRRRRSVAREAAIVGASSARNDGGLLRQRTPAEPSGANGVHQCIACRGTMSILGPL
jgi:hypothetical protein